MKKLLFVSLITALLSVILAGCATYKVQFESEREWIVGKPYPIQITIKNTDKLGDVVVHYSFNGTGQQTQALEQTGTSFLLCIDH